MPTARIIACVVAFFLLSGHSSWAQVDLKISQLPAASALTGVEAFPCDQAGGTFKCTVTQAVTFTYSLLSGDCTATSGGAITCTKTGGVAFGTLATASVPLSKANGGNGTATPGITAGTGITLGGSWPAQSVALTTPVSVANGGTGTASPGLVAGTNVTITGSWPNQTINSTGGGSSALSSYTTARYYTLGGTASAAGAAATANLIVCNKGLLYAQLTFSVLTVNITTAGSSNIQSALYADTGGLPGALLSSTPSVVDTGTLGTAMTLAVNVQAGPGAIWFCTNVNDSTVVMTGNSKVTLIPATLIGAVVGAAGLAQLVSTVSNVTGLSCSGASCNGGSSTFGTWPATLVGSTWTTVAGNTTPELYFQPFSVP